MKKLFSLFLALLMVTALFAVFPAVQANADESAVISDKSPVVLGNAGKEISLDGYTVKLNDGKTLDDPQWTYEGNTVTSVKFDSKGVYELTASQDGKSRTVYAVIKNEQDTEYVLYENNFDSEADIEGLKQLGTNAGQGIVSVADGKLTIDAFTNNTYTSALYLPEWIADFGNYNIEVSANMAQAKDTSRWFSVGFRHISDSNYMHMCTRQNMTGSSGIECVQKVGSGWTYLSVVSYKENMNASKYYTYGVSIFDNILEFTVDGNTVVFLNDITTAGATNLPQKGKVALQANQCKMNFDYIKVTVALEAPTYESDAVDPMIAAEHEATNILNAVSNVAIVNESDINTVVSAEVNPDSVIVKYDGAVTAEKLDTLLELCKENSVVPGVYIKNTDDGTAVRTWCKDNDFWDINLASDDGEALKAVRKATPAIRTVLVLDSIEGKTAQQVRETARKYAVNAIVISLADADKATVRALQQLHLTVWVSGEKMSKTDIAWAISAGAHAVVSDDYNLVYTVMKEVYGENTLTKTPSIIGHRGNPSQAPENSISGYITAVKSGATEVECDIYLTADKEIIIMHDNTLNRTTNYTGSKTVTQMTLEEIKQYRLKDNAGKVTDEEVPTLVEFFEALKDYNVYYVIELKSGDQAMVKPLYDLIKKYNAQDRVNIISFAGNVLQTTYNTDPIISAGYLNGTLQFTEKHPFPAEYHQSVLRLIKDSQAYNSTVNMAYSKTSGVLYQLLSDRGITLWPWTYGNNDANLYNGFLWGYDGLTTDYCQNLKNTVRFFDVDKEGTNTVELGQTLTAKASITTYGDAVKETANVDIVWIENGIEAVYDIETGVFSADKTGTASFMLSYSTKLPNGASYVLYSQPVTVDVVEPAPESTEVSDAESGVDGNVIIICAVIAVIAACGAVVFVILKKKK